MYDSTVREDNFIFNMLFVVVVAAARALPLQSCNCRDVLLQCQVTSPGKYQALSSAQTLAGWSQH